MNRDINPILPFSPLPLAPTKGRPASGKEGKPSFEQALQKELVKGPGLTFSAHAEKRLKDRNIVLAAEDLSKLDQAVSRAEAKGARESLILYGELVLIASIKNRTVVTALDGKAAVEHVYTNIDSAVIVRP